MLRLHDWRNKWNEEGQRYEVCDRCGAYRDRPILLDHPGQQHLPPGTEERVVRNFRKNLPA